MQALLNEGWKVIIVWECGLRGVARTASTLEHLSAVLVSGKRTHLEIPASPPGAPRLLPRERAKPRKGTEYGRRSAL